MNSKLDAAGTAVEPVPAAQLIGISKHFGRVVACDAVDLTLHRGRVHGVLGENGAGKSTLMKVLIGLVTPDAGSIRIDGEPAHIPDPIVAARLGIAMVHQHFSLVEPLTVWENVALGDVGRLDPRATRLRIGELSEQYGLHIDPDARVRDLSAGMRQRVEIIKCLRRDPSVVILDEPTSVLSPEESEALFEALRLVVADHGKAVALVSHKLGEILRATDDITIMRDGRVVETRATVGAAAQSLARAMVGREVSLRGERAALGIVDASEQAATTHHAGDVVLTIDDARLTGPDGRPLLDGLSLTVRAGEVVAVAGVEGNGQRALGDVLSSLLALDAGSVAINGREVATGVAGAMAEAGVSVIPEDRHDSGCVLDFTVAENLFVAEPHRVARWGLMDAAAMNDAAKGLIARFAVSCTGPDAPLWSLSGGNQQRVVLARELSHDPTLLVAAQPTRGLDVGAIEYMSAQLRVAADTGVAVLLISTELEEVLDLADRIVVIFAGRIIGEMSRGEVDLDRLGMLMGGEVPAS